MESLTDGGVEEQGGQEADSSSRDQEVRYGTTPHSYLGEVDDIACNSVLLEEGSLVTLPLFYMEGIVLFPGATLPMRILDPRDKAAIELARSCEEAPCTLGVVHGRSRMSLFQRALVGTTAEIRQLRSGADGSVNIVAKGCQRFRTVRAWTNADGVLCVQVRILTEDLPLRIPRDAFGKLACIFSFQSGKDPLALLEQKKNELKYSTLEASQHESINAWKSCGRGNVPREDEDQEWRSRREKRNQRTAHAKQTHHANNSSMPSSSPKEENQCRYAERREEFRKRWSVDAAKCLSMAQRSVWPHWVYRMHDADDLARRAADLWQQVVQLPSIYNLLRRPEMLAYHIASKIPVQDSTRQELLEIDGVVYRLQREIQLLESMNDLNCRWCLSLIARRSDILVMSAEGPLDAFVNNYGVVHETLTLIHTQGLILLGKPETEHSWFPGYSWTTAFCCVCKAHMGWLYKSVKKGLHPRLFWGVRRAQLVEGTVVEHGTLQRG